MSKGSSRDGRPAACAKSKPGSARGKEPRGGHDPQSERNDRGSEAPSTLGQGSTVRGNRKGAVVRPPQPSILSGVGRRVADLRRGTTSALSQRRRGLLVVGRVLGLLVLGAGAVAVARLVEQHLQTSDAFAIRSIAIAGSERLSEDEVIAVAGLAVGSNIFAIAPETAKARLDEHPWIAAAEVERDLPDAIRVRIREHQAALILALGPGACTADNPSHDVQPDGNGGQGEGLSGADDGRLLAASCDQETTQLFLVSQEGIVFKRAEADDPYDLPVITGAERSRFIRDARYRSGLLIEIVALLHDYRGAGLWRREPIAELHVENDDELAMYVGDDATLVRLGRAPFREKLMRLRRVFDRVADQEARAAYVYLDNERRPDRVTVRLR